MITSLRFFSAISNETPIQVLSRAIDASEPFHPRSQMFRCDRPQGVTYVQDEVLPNGALASLWRTDGGTEYIHIESFAGASWWRREVIK